jgi:hypothetical protein
MNWKNLLALSFIAIAVGIGTRQLKKVMPSPPIEILTPTPTISLKEVKGVKEELEIKINRSLAIDAQQAILRDVAGFNSQGIATRKFSDRKFELTILADLPQPDKNHTYQSWLVRGSPDSPEFNLISTGQLLPRKGGWVVDFIDNNNLISYAGVVVTMETIQDQTPEKHILEGSF